MKPVSIIHTSVKKINKQAYKKQSYKIFYYQHDIFIFAIFVVIPFNHQYRKHENKGYDATKNNSQLHDSSPETRSRKAAPGRRRDSE